MGLRQAAAGGTADLHGFEFRAVFQTAADVEDNFPQGRAHGHLDEARVLNGTGEGEGLAAGASGGTDGLKPIRALQDDLGHVGVGFHVVEHRRLFPQTLFDGSGGLGSGHTPIALNGGGQGRALAADESAGAPVDVHMEAKVGAQDVVAQKAPLFQLGNGVAQPGNGHGILSPDIDVAVLRPDGVARDHHALDELEGIALHNGAVHKGAGVALVAVADHIPLGFLLTGYLLPLPTGGEAAAAPTPKAGLVHLVHHALPGHLEHGLLQGGEAAGGQILVQGLGVELAAVFQNNPGLLGNKGNFLRLDVGHLVLLVEQPLNDLVADDALFQNFLAVVRLNLDILNDPAVLLNPHQGAQLAEALAAGFLYAYRLALMLTAAGGEYQLHALGLIHQFAEKLVNSMGAGGNTAGTGANQDPAVIVFDVLAGRALGLSQFLNRLNH